MCEPNRTAVQWASARGTTPPLQSLTHMSMDTTTPPFSAPHRGHSEVVQQHNGVLPTHIAHTMTVSHAHIREALQHSLKCTPSHTPTERKRKSQEKNNNNKIPTAHKALTIQ
ncbi:uncharacterized protein TM35_000651220 [Trypanosoma theileri]|uniref:Uncharacterized protein n=1 Tax=Trypanosoma theileri TaxID=67003 RepID=A0A1X0NHK8_9TRYP|nr:uncharacterized protein TM35_000651220 [Trypanosoma theileri]ORC83560.1 hypothetical protein TM35_000651220 [Trypanosoma theileri]